jgi:MFS transporter, DHA1 family, inner membrane transport protein
LSARFVPTALLLGNFVIGTSIMAPAGMLNELSRDLHVSIAQASILVTLGAVVLCLGSPLLSWATSRMDRRKLLCAILVIIMAAHLAAAFTTSFAALLALRLVMVAAAAPFTPQAAGVVGLILPLDRRASAIAYVFLGWSLAAAAGLPLMTAIASRFGHAWCFMLIAIIAALSCVLLAWRLPAKLHTPAVDLKAWRDLFRNRLVLLLLLVTILQMTGQFVIFTFIGPLLALLANAGPDAISIAFALYGVAGFLGNVAATQVVGRFGTFRTSLLSNGCVGIGIAIWAAGAGLYSLMAAGLFIWGLGFAAANSMQQARLVVAAPTQAGSAVALNTSALYIGQATGSAIGSALFVHGHLLPMGYVAAAVMIAALTLVARSRPAG